jgi:carbamoyltransferase
MDGFPRMIICGLKLTHDDGIALPEDEKLPCNIEREKLDNSLRYQPLDRLEVVEEMLLRYNCRPTDIDVFVVDEWFAAPGDRTPLLRILNGGVPLTVEVAPYLGTLLYEPVCRPRGALAGRGLGRGYGAALVQVDVDPFTVTSLGSFFPVYGSAFADYAAQFDVFREASSEDPKATEHLIPRNLNALP